MPRFAYESQCAKVRVDIPRSWDKCQGLVTDWARGASEWQGGLTAHQAAASRNRSLHGADAAGMY